MSFLTPKDLTAGDIVSTGFRLYRSNFRPYFIIALIGTLWLFFPVLGFLIWGVGISVLADRFSSGLSILIALSIFVALIVLTIQAVIRGCLNIALISRLAYAEFTQNTLPTPETIAETRKLLKPKGRRILFTFVWSFLILFTINLMLSVGNAPLTALFTPLFQSWDGEWLALLIANLITFSVYTWISARFFLVEMPIVLEENLNVINAMQSIRRSWSLAQGSVWRILLVMTIAFLVTIPLYSLASVPPIVGLVAVIPMFNLESEAIQTALLTRFLPSFVLGILLFLVMNMIVMGFWQSIKAVLYYDLRSRREGFDITLSHRQ